MVNYSQFFVILPVYWDALARKLVAILCCFGAGF